MLRAVGLVKSYRGRRDADPRPGGVDLTVKAGEIVVVTGPSGSGKSTLLNVLGLLEDGDGGDVWYQDDRVTALGRAAKSRARGGYVGFLFQSFLLLPSLTALENVLLAGALRRALGLRHRQRALDLLAEVGVADRRAISRRSSRAASSSASRSAARCSTTRRCCWPTSRPGASTTPTAR